MNHIVESEQNPKPTADSTNRLPYPDDDEINLLDLALVLMKHKAMIIKVTLFAAFLAAGISLLMKNIYRAEIVLAPVSSEEGKGGRSTLGGLVGLAAMAGIPMGSDGSVEENLAVLKSRDFLWKYVQEKKLMPVLFEDAWDAEAKKWKEEDPEEQPGQMDVARLFNEGIMTVEVDKKTNLITVAIEWHDKVLAAEWANDLVARLNAYLARQAIERSQQTLKYLNEELMRTPVEEMRKTLFDLIATEQKKAMLANTQKDFAFKVLDPAVIPDKKAKPKRTLIVILATMVAFFLSVIVAFIKEAMTRSAQDAEQKERWDQLRKAISWRKAE